MWVVSDGVENGTETGTSFKQALFFKSIGLNIHDTMIWKKDTANFPETTRYPQAFEYMFIFSKGKPKTVNLIKDRKNLWAGAKPHGTYRDTNGNIKGRGEKWGVNMFLEYGARFNVWEIPGEKQNKTGHPAVFPRALARDHILTWSNLHDVVLDPFSGSGTTAIEALNNNREFIGFEISKEYYEKSLEYIKCETSQTNIFQFLTNEGDKQ